MSGFWQGFVGGAVPAVLLILVYLCTLAGRLAKIETNICWLKKEMTGSLLRSKDRTL